MSNRIRFFRKLNFTLVSLEGFDLVFWNGHSKGTKFVIEYAKKQGKLCRVIILEK